MTLESLVAFVQSRTAIWMCLPLLLTGVGAWLSADDARSMTLRLFLLTSLPLLPIGIATSVMHTPAIQLERTLPIHLRLHEFTLAVIWSGLAISCVLVALAVPEPDSFIMDRIVRSDWIGNFGAFMGLALAWARLFPSRLAWVPGFIWAAGALVGALPDLETTGMVPNGFWWWPVAGAADTDAQWTKLALLTGGSILFLLPDFKGRG